MKKIKNFYSYALGLFFQDDLISFYAFFTSIFTEIAYLWAFQSELISFNSAISISLLLYILNVILLGLLKGSFECTKFSNKVSIAYIAIFIGIFAISCYLNREKFIMHTILTIIPIAFSGLSCAVRTFQNTATVSYSNTISTKIELLFQTKIFLYLSEFIIIGIPYILLVVFFAIIPGIPLIIKILFPIVYLFVAPLFALIEDNIAAMSIFEIAFDWD